MRMSVINNALDYGGKFIASFKQRRHQPKKTLIFVLVWPMIFTLTKSCQVEKCTREQAQQMDERVILPRKSVEYCQVLNDYISCLNETSRNCHSRLDFHSALSAARQRWKHYYCGEFKRQLTQAGVIRRGSARNTCTFWPHPNESDSEKVYCAIFGRAMHLRAFSMLPHNDDDNSHTALAHVERCVFSGTRPMLDNRFFIIQLSAVADSELWPSHSADFLYYNVKKVIILIKAYGPCIKHQKVYEANIAKTTKYSAETSEETEQRIPVTFADGTAEISIRESDSTVKKIVDVTVVDITTVQIRLHYLRTTITIRRDATFLSVFVDAPRRLLHTSYDGMPSAQPCHASMSGTIGDDEEPADLSAMAAAAAICDEKAATRFYEALARPRLFQKCVLAEHLGRKKVTRCDEIIATKKCADSALFGDYFDACVFDLLLTDANNGPSIDAVLKASQLAQSLDIATKNGEEQFASYEDNDQSLVLNKEIDNYSTEDRARQSLDVYARNDELAYDIEHECGVSSTMLPKELKAQRGNKAKFAQSSLGVRAHGEADKRQYNNENNKQNKNASRDTSSSRRHHASIFYALAPALLCGWTRVQRNTLLTLL